MSCFRQRNKIAVFVTVFLWGSLTGSSVLAQSKQTQPQQPKTSNLAPKNANTKKFRNFYQVLEDVMSDFEYDLKNGEVQGLKDLSIKDIATSENIPPSFKTHLELLISERIIKNAKAKIIQCLPCRSRKATLSGNSVVISSTRTNQSELIRLAQAAGIANFMDVAFAYQPTGMILSFYVTEVESGSVVWSRSYNSETSRAAAFRRGVDYQQLEEARKHTEYQPKTQYRPIVYYLFERDTSSYQGVLGFGFRMMERYDNRKKEVGFELNYLMDSSSLAGDNSAEDNLYSGFNLTLLFMHAWNFIGDAENFNRMRGSLFAGIGGTYASGFLGALIRTGYEWRMGKHWAVQTIIGYRPSATQFIDGTSQGSVSGLEFGVGISALF